jgi:hypothetical protein
MSSSSAPVPVPVVEKPHGKRVKVDITVAYFAYLLTSADTEELGHKAVQAYGQEAIDEGRWDGSYVRSLLTRVNNKLKDDGHPWRCKHPELHTSKNAEYAAKKAAERLSPGANFMIDLDEEIYPEAVRILEANMVGEEVEQEDVTVSIAALTGRRIGEILDPRDGAPQWTISDQEDKMTLSYLEKQGASPRPHTFPVLCDRKLVEHGITTVRAHFREEVEKQDGAEDELGSVRKKVNEALKRMFPEVEAAWLEFSPVQKGGRGFTVHCLRAFYGAKLWSIHDTPGGNYLAHLRKWLGHLYESTSKIYEKVRHESGVKLISAVVAEPEPATETEFIDFILTLVTNCGLLDKDRKRKIQKVLSDANDRVGVEVKKAAAVAKRQKKA